MKKNAVHRHVNGNIAQLKQQVSELGFLVVLHVDILSALCATTKIPLPTVTTVLVVRFCR